MSLQRAILMTTCFAGIAALLGITHFYHERQRAEEQHQLSAALDRVALALRDGLRLRMFAVEDLRAFLLTSPEIPDAESFNRFVAQILPGYPAVRTLQYADTDNIIRYTYPLEGNENALGLNLMDRPAARYVQEAIESRRMTLSEPTVTVQGPLAIVARIPIFRGETYLGLAQGVFEVGTLLEDAVASRAPHFNLVLQDEVGRVFWGAPAPARHTAQSTVRVANLVWSLELGWTGPPAIPFHRMLLAVWLPGLLALAGILAVIHLTLRHLTGLTAAIETKTAELHLAVQAAEIGLWDWNLLTNDVYFSPEWKAQLGYTDEELPNRYEEWESRLHPDERPVLLAQIAAATQPPWPTYAPEFRLRHRDGAYRWILVRSEVIRDGGDRPYRMLGCHIDITERKQAEEELRAAKNLRESTLESLNEVVMVIEPVSRTILQCNSAAESVFGYDAEELLGQSTAVLHLDAMAHERFAHLSEPVLERGEAFQCEYEMRKKDGTIIQTEHVVTAMGGSGGWKGGVVSVVRDVTERRQAESERTQLLSALENAADAVIVVNPEGEIQYVNSALEGMAGFLREELIGRNAGTLLETEPAESTRAAVQQALQRGEAWSGNLSLRRKGGSAFEGAATIAPVLDHRGDTVSYVATLRDVSDQIKLESQLRHAQKMEAIGTLAGGIAHDFNNILAAILGYGELVQAQLPPETSTHADMDRVLAAANRAQSLVRQILTFGRRAEDVRQTVDFADVVDETLQLLRPSLPSTITIETAIDADLPQVLADPSQLHQVIVNLCTNAYQAMEAQGGTLRITLDAVDLDASFVGMRPDLQTGPYVVLAVSDTGPGMDPETVARIFEPFFTTKPQGKGTGLGLATVHGIVASHGGAITVSSEPGHGSRFEVYLPRIRGKAAAAPEPEVPVRGGNERILVVDDEVLLAQLLQKSLEKFGYEVLALGSSTAALALFEHDPNRFDIVITDLTMPHMTGRQLVTHMRALRQDLPVILMTGFSDPALIEALASIGVTTVITKPVRPAHIARIVRELLDSALGDASNG